MKYIFVCNILGNTYLQFTIYIYRDNWQCLRYSYKFLNLNNTPSIWTLYTTYLVCEFSYEPCYALVHSTMYVTWSISIIYTAYLLGCRDSSAIQIVLLFWYNKYLFFFFTHQMVEEKNPVVECPVSSQNADKFSQYFRHFCGKKIVPFS